MDRIRIRGGKRLHGTIPVSGAKNAALPILCATLLSDGRIILRDPDLDRLAAIAERFGRELQLFAE